MSNFGLLIWSRSRPAQLDLLLSSIEKFCPNQFTVYVLFKLDEDFKNGYSKCQTYHHNVNFIQEHDFCSQTKQILSYHDFMCVSTDDTVVFNKFKLTSKMMDNVGCFSLRLGKNTLVQEPFSGRLQPALSRFVEENDTICWDSRDYSATDNYGFKLGHDMVVYGPRYRELVQELEFKKTNEVETKLFYQQEKINPFIRSFHHSVAVNIPSNNQSGATLADNSLPLLDTNQKFTDGKRFRLDEVEQMKVVGCHQPQALVMV